MSSLSVINGFIVGTFAFFVISTPLYYYTTIPSRYIPWISCIIGTSLFIPKIFLKDF